MKKFLNYLKLRDKLLLMYVLSVFIPIVLTNVVFYNVTTSNLRNQKIRDADMALDNLKNELRVTIDQGVGLAYSLYGDSIFNKTITRKFTSEKDYVETFNSYLRGALADQNVQGVRWYQVYTDNPTVLASGYIDRLTDKLRDTGWYTQSKASSSRYPTFIYSEQKFSLIQKLNNYHTSGIEQLVKIDLNMERIHQIFFGSAFNGMVYLVDPQGRVQYGNDTAKLPEGVPFKEISYPKNFLAFKNVYSGINYLEGWTLEGVIDEENVLKEVRKSRSFVIWLACINFVLPSIIIAAMSRSIHVRLVRILKHMKKVKAQNFQTIPHEEARDEIGQLTIEFNRMTETVNSLINEVYLADIQKKNLELKQQQAQLHALHSQINPHFLFNSLESVRMRSLIKGEKETAKIIQHMAKMFRKSVSWSHNYVTVREELELIESFLTIQQYRFGDKLEYSIVADPAALEHRIPKMVLLPFVENASIHGIESSPDKGIIVISVAVQRDRLIFRLEDNGIGMSPEKLEELKGYLEENDDIGERVGMKNAYYRLKLCFQDRFMFAMDAREGTGTYIEISLPLLEAAP
ncbi:sensor histidine kinase [Paenibacillus riograndensis]|uniref:Sensor with HAMP domain n=2 Tax=Paenibacillus riograndensis TaxID=483937 RepID=A0A0E3WIP1_9BACL|nr:sensor histidine kinase [Paenibacillus riograndensis]CQR57378.1 sensor with HAMP domain [Paenibacillus riograndensis SBR5]